MSLAEFNLYDANNHLVTGAQASSTCLYSPPGQGPSAAVDGDSSTQFTCHVGVASLLLTFASPTTISSYDFITADSTTAANDPRSWALRCRTSPDNLFTELHTVTDFPMVSARMASYGGFLTIQ